jgi:hypothetical protein
MRILDRIFNPRPPNRVVLRKMVETKEQNYATLKRAAVESGNVELLKFIKQQEADLALLKAEADLLAGNPSPEDD